MKSTNHREGRKGFLRLPTLCSVPFSEILRALDDAAHALRRFWAL